MRAKSWMGILWVMTLLVMVLSACTGGVVVDVEPPSATPLEAQIEAVDDPTLQAEVPTAAPTATEVDSPREPREGLEATDPATVVLASGEPQIIEFFAFW
jgi:hypothetical protein